MAEVRQFPGPVSGTDEAGRLTRPERDGCGRFASGTRLRRPERSRRLWRGGSRRCTDDTGSYADPAGQGRYCPAQ